MQGNWPSVSLIVLKETNEANYGFFLLFESWKQLTLFIK